MLRIALALALVVACHHDPEPAKLEPGEVAPLPSASGTPIGFLLDERIKLHLTDDQVLQLRQIDTSLAADLDKIDSRMREVNKASDPPPQQSSGMGRGGRHGGMGGMGGGGNGGNGGTSGRHRGSGSGSGGGHSKTDVDRLTEQRASDVRDAVTRAFTHLDDGQIASAKQVLSDHDVDLEPDKPATAPPQAPPIGSAAGSAAADPDDDTNQP